MSHIHSVYDNNKHFSIDPVTREITNESGKFVLIQHDHNSERFTFEIPREIDGHDMSLCNVVQIHYLNVELDKANGALENAEAEGTDIETVVLDDVIYIPTGTVYPGIYESDDIQVSPDNDDAVICSWLISRNATQYFGTLNFICRFACVAEDGTEEYGWSTAPYEGIIISDGIFNSDIVIAEYHDLLEKWRADILAIVRSEINDYNQTGIANGSVTRAKLAQDALYSPIVVLDSSNSNYALSASDIGKTIYSHTGGTTEYIITLTSAASATMPVGTEIAICRIFGQSFKVMLSGVEVCILGESRMSGATLSIPDPHSMIAIKKILTASGSDYWLVTGNVEVVS